MLGKFGKEERELSCRERVGGIMAAVSEYVFLFGMGVEIDEHLYSVVMLEDVLFDVHYLF